MKPALRKNCSGTKQAKTHDNKVKTHSERLLVVTHVTLQLLHKANRSFIVKQRMLACWFSRSICVQDRDPKEAASRKQKAERARTHPDSARAVFLLMQMGRQLLLEALVLLLVRRSLAINVRTSRMLASPHATKVLYKNRQRKEIEVHLFFQFLQELLCRGCR